MDYRFDDIRPSGDFAEGLTREQLAGQLAQAGVPRGAALMVHASLRAIGAVKGGAFTVVEALCGHIGDGLLVIPTYTRAPEDGAQGVYDPYATPSRSGRLGEALLCCRPDAVRSLHPDCPVAVCGGDAASFIDGESYAATPFPRDGCMGRLLDAGGYILLCGVGLDKCAMMYCAEEWSGAEGMLSRPETRYIADHFGVVRMSAVSGYLPEKLRSAVFYNKLRQPLIEAGAAVECRLGRADCLLIDSAKLIALATAVLLRAPDAFSDDAPLSRRMLGSVRKELEEAGRL